ncbi:unnamed protein product [marine sediment metagenome]|uniref:Uncharacterized protein n=1 Tax=marine sediment metagenome TaxID=412755 RepID=X1K9K8_9ZZZZ
MLKGGEVDKESEIKVLTNAITYVMLYMAAEISFIADVGGPLSPLREGFFLWVKHKSVIVFF